MSNPLAAIQRLISELRRRHVFRVATVYAVVSWLTIQVAVNTFPFLNLPGWLVTAVITLCALGLPLAVVLAWSFEITPEGVRRAEAAAPPAPAPRPAPARRLRLLPDLPVRPAPSPPEAEDGRGGVRRSPPSPERVQRASLAGLRHELRTPINAIIGYAEMLVEDAHAAGEENGTAELEQLGRTGRDLLSLLNRVLADDADADALGAERLRARLREELDQPARALIANTQSLIRRSAGRPHVADLERVAAAAARLVALVEELNGADAAGGTLSQMQSVAEGVMSRLPEIGARAADRSRGLGSTLLVVDDNPLNRDLLSRQLAREGYSVLTASDGREALERMRTRAVDLVLLDVMMPGMDGIQVLEAMQRDAALAEIPVVMISALDEIDSVIGCIEKGAVDYLAKPFDPVLLRARLGATLELRRLREHIHHLGHELARERDWSDRVLLSALPASMAERARAGEEVFAEAHPEATVVVLRMEGLEALVSREGPLAMVERVAEVTAWLGALVGRCGGSLVQATGSTYTILVTAAADGQGCDHAEVAAEVALGVADELLRPRTGGAFPARVGIHTGPVVTGTCGAAQLTCGVWGEAARTAEALAMQGPLGAIHVSAATDARLSDAYLLEGRGVVELSGQSQMRTYLLTGRRQEVGAGS